MRRIAFILAAGLGTRLKPWTLHHPKALVPVGGVPMLERVIVNLKAHGFDDIIVNVHHFSDQVVDFLVANDFGVKISISDESGRLLDTGGGLLRAYEKFGDSGLPLLVHNVDILSNANLSEFYGSGDERNLGGKLLTSKRESSRKLIFDNSSKLVGWHDLKSGKYRPEGLKLPLDCHENAFSGIYLLYPQALEEMRRLEFPKIFPIMDYFLSKSRSVVLKECFSEDLELIDIGKPESLEKANMLF